MNAASALGNLRSRRAVVPLLRALNDEKWYVRQQAAKSLGRIGDGQATKELRLSLRDSRPAVVKASREALRMIAQKDS